MKKSFISSGLILAAGLSFGVSSASAESSCTVANYTVDGEFDQTGYAQCVTDELPKTGSDPYGLIGVGIAVGVLGVSTVVVSRRKNRSAHV
jgi:LPXTG-motif cell wall-anchored protein